MLSRGRRIGPAEHVTGDLRLGEGSPRRWRAWARSWTRCTGWSKPRSGPVSSIWSTYRSSVDRVPSRVLTSLQWESAVRSCRCHQRGASVARTAPKATWRPTGRSAPSTSGSTSASSWPRAWCPTTMPSAATPGGRPVELRLAELGDADRAIVCQWEARIVRNFPHVAVEIGEEAGVAAIERLGRSPVTVAPAPSAVAISSSTSAFERTLCARTMPLKPVAWSSVTPQSSASLSRPQRTSAIPPA